MTEPSTALITAARRLTGRVLILGGSGKMGPELAEMLCRADEAAGVKREIVIASTFSSQATRNHLSQLNVRCIQTDLTDPEQIRALPDAPYVIYMIGFKFGSATDHRRTFHVNSIVPYLVGCRYPDSTIIVFSSTNVYAPRPYVNGTISGSCEEDLLRPHGVYGWSIVGRESAFATTALNNPRQLICNFRLAYAQHLYYGVVRDLAEMVQHDKSISLTVPAVNLISQRDAIDYALRGIEYAANPPWTVNIAGPARFVTDIISSIGNNIGRHPHLCGAEGNEALIADDRRCRITLGNLRDSSDEVIEAVSLWVKAGGNSWNKPTMFGRAKGTY